jgi:hypothetical protein
MGEDTERSLILSLVHDLSELFASGLSESPVVDRYLDEDVFGEAAGRKPTLILIGASHLLRVSAHLDFDRWEVINLCKPGFRITEESVSEIAGQIEDIKKRCFHRK